MLHFMSIVVLPFSAETLRKFHGPKFRLLDFSFVIRSQYCYPEFIEVNMATKKRKKPLYALFTFALITASFIAQSGDSLEGPLSSVDEVTSLGGLSKPNILLIILDDWGKDKSGLYSEFNKDEIAIPTPTIDSIAQNGVRFTNAWASPNCSPSRVTLVTGQYPLRNGVKDVIEVEGAVGIDTSDPQLLPHLLKGSGYSTGMIGKWHLTSESDNVNNNAPLKAGFDFWTGTNGSFGPDAFTFPVSFSAYYVTPPIQCNFNTAPTVCEENQSWKTSLEYQNNTDLTEELWSQYESTYQVDQAINWINDREQDKPWFMYLAFQAPHSPLVLPPKHLLSSDLITRVEEKVRSFTGDPGYAYTEGQRLLSFEVTGEAESPGDFPPTERLPDTTLARAAYAAMVAAVDTEITRLFENIDLSNTYIILLGDNGTSGDVMDEDQPGFPNKDANLRGKGTMFQGGIEIPFMLSGPGVVEPGRTSSALVHTSDVYTTILDLAGVVDTKDGNQIDGVSFTNVIDSTEDPQGSRGISWSDYGPNPAANSRLNPNDAPWGYAIRDNRFKLKSDAVYDESGNVECKVSLPEDGICTTQEWKVKTSLYDLIEDPTEQMDLLEDGGQGLELWQYLRMSLLRIHQDKIFDSVD